jgi:predicted Zn-dependent protease with MMP-like domain
LPGGRWFDYAAGVNPNWEWLSRTALDEVQALIRSLPRPVRAKAEPIAVLLEKRPGKALRAEGIEADTLGLFNGPSLRDGTDGEATPPHIVLYIENIWEAADAAEAEYRREIRTTYLHELGHYLGLEEDDLEERELE